MRRFDGDYKDTFRKEVNRLVMRRLSRDERIKAIDEMINAYTDETGKRPDSAQLERLANQIMLEELTDNHPDKVTREEYPIFTQLQLERRRNVEVNITAAETVDSSGIDRRIPTRRKRSNNELTEMDIRLQRYNKEHVKPGPVISYNLSGLPTDDPIRERYYDKIDEIM